MKLAWVVGLGLALMPLTACAAPYDQDLKTAVADGKMTLAQADKVQEARNVVKVFRTAGEASLYWPCLHTKLVEAGQHADAAKNPIDTDPEFHQAVIDAQVACDTHFQAFKVAVLKEGADHGYSNDITSDDQLRYLVYQMWFITVTGRTAD